MSGKTCSGPVAYIDDGANYVSLDNLIVQGGIGGAGTGACCLGNGTCVDGVSTAQCVQQGGAFLAPNSVCGDGSICNGACCSGMAACEDNKKINECTGGQFRGFGSTCAVAGCECSVPFADADADGDVDQLDFAVFQGCFEGEGVAVSGSCECFDRHPAGGGDQDVDMEDLDLFEACASGPGIALDPTCGQ
jgi:hypothetical protein